MGFDTSTGNSSDPITDLMSCQRWNKICVFTEFRWMHQCKRCIEMACHRGLEGVVPRVPDATPQSIQDRFLADEGLLTRCSLDG